MMLMSYEESYVKAFSFDKLAPGQMNLIIHNRAGVQLATAEKGRLFVEEAVRRTVEYLKKMMEGEIGMPELKYFP